MKTQILVTGGLGYIGSHTVVELIQKGFEVIIVDDLSNSERSVLDSIEKITGIRPIFYEECLINLDSVQEIYKKHNIHTTIHFAAFKAVGESVEKPLMYYRNNLISTLNILECVSKFGSNNIVFSSSATVYGNPDSCPIDETAPVKQPTSPYGNSKKINEEIIADICQANKQFNAVILRYFNPIGAHKSGLIGENPKGIPNNLLPYVTQTAKGLRSELTIFGNDYETKDGTGVRDYIHVVDLANAHTLAVDYLSQKQYNSNLTILNLGTGKGYSVLDIVNTFKNEIGIDINYKFGPRRSGDIAYCYANPLKAKKVLNWEAKYNLNEMILSAWNFEKNKG